MRPFAVDRHGFVVGGRGAAASRSCRLRRSTPGPASRPPATAAVSKEAVMTAQHRACWSGPHRSPVPTTSWTCWTSTPARTAATSSPPAKTARTNRPWPASCPPPSPGAPDTVRSSLLPAARSSPGNGGPKWTWPGSTPWPSAPTRTPPMTPTFPPRCFANRETHRHEPCAASTRSAKRKLPDSSTLWGGHFGSSHRLGFDHRGILVTRHSRKECHPAGSGQRAAIRTGRSRKITAGIQPRFPPLPLHGRAMRPRPGALPC